MQPWITPLSSGNCFQHRKNTTFYVANTEGFQPKLCLAQRNCVSGAAFLRNHAAETTPPCRQARARAGRGATVPYLTVFLMTPIALPCPVRQTNVAENLPGNFCSAVEESRNVGAPHSRAEAPRDANADTPRFEAVRRGDSFVSLPRSSRRRRGGSPRARWFAGSGACWGRPLSCCESCARTRRCSPTRADRPRPTRWP